jgi:hypothetical protein
MIIYGDGHAPDSQSYFYYDGKVELRFDRKQWKYFRVMPDGSTALQYGVTSVVKIIDKSEPLMRWAVRKAMEKAKRLLMEQGYCHPHSVVSERGEPLPLYEEILDGIIASAKKADKEELEEAGEVGHAAHEWIESYINAILENRDDRRLELLAKFPLDPRAANACVAALIWMQEHDVRWICTERKVYSLEHGFAGTLDGLAIVSSCADPLCCPHEYHDKLTLVDWKTSNYLYLEYLLQAPGAYRHAYMEEHGGNIEHAWIIRLGKEDGEFDPWHVYQEDEFAEYWEGYRNALALYVSVQKIKGRIEEIADTKKAAIKAAKKLEENAKLALKCKESDEYKGVRRKKGCNGTETVCQACAVKYAELHPAN